MWREMAICRQRADVWGVFGGSSRSEEKIATFATYPKPTVTDAGEHEGQRSSRTLRTRGSILDVVAGLGARALSSLLRKEGPRRKGT